MISDKIKGFFRNLSISKFDFSPFGARDRNRTGMAFLPKDFKSFASTYSATWAKW